LGDPLKGNLLLFYKPLHLEAQQVSTRIEVRRHHKTVKKNKKGMSKSSNFTAMIIDNAAPPPPELPLGTIQAIATKRCQIPPSEVTEEALTSTSG
jgi:hypothetical protein